MHKKNIAEELKDQKAKNNKRETNYKLDERHYTSMYESELYEN